MTVLKAGSRLKSQVDDTELIVIKAPADDVDLLVGGHPAIDIKAEPDAGLTLDPTHGDGALLGKRYTREAQDIELLITKGGTGSLSINGETLEPKESKPLPSSDNEHNNLTCEPHTCTRHLCYTAQHSCAATRGTPRRLRP